MKLKKVLIILLSILMTLLIFCVEEKSYAATNALYVRRSSINENKIVYGIYYV